MGSVGARGFPGQDGLPGQPGQPGYPGKPVSEPHPDRLLWAGEIKKKKTTKKWLKETVRNIRPGLGECCWVITGAQLSVCVWALWRRWECPVNLQACSITGPVCSLRPAVDSAESKCNCVLQGKPPSDEHLLKLCADVLRSKYLFVFYVTLLTTRERQARRQGKKKKKVWQNTHTPNTNTHTRTAANSSHNSLYWLTLIITS